MQPDELRALRKSANLTQSELAELVGLSHGFIGEMERGEKAIEPRTAFNIENAIKRRKEILHLAATLHKRYRATTDWSAGQYLEMATAIVDDRTHYEEPRGIGPTLEAMQGWQAQARARHPDSDFELVGFRVVPTGDLMAIYARKMQREFLGGPLFPSDGGRSMTDLRDTVDGGILPNDLKQAATRLMEMKESLHRTARSNPGLAPVADAVQELATMVQGICGHVLRLQANAIERF